ncbi:CarD family transcriptional regulator [Sedimentibacter acidaminivorans]|uniref:CarD family transcriptional regulator n=1 Tax=Sedimentibacter acidaminivorans TaxID=913099 RepID=A0ABS4GDQ9_9FIRM|nr:CarD family transcriptional regulator [Sedimentibacter acidaminivorans]MBP1925838.1 CarD family transcriptional regulator [Sedimentibacter acidaminivorans]
MFKVNELIIYGNDGICRVEDIRKMAMANTDVNKLYYVLKPLYHDVIIYSPIDTNVFMRPIITYEKALKIIDKIPDMKVEIYNNNGLRELNDYYKSLIQTHKCEDLIQLIKMVYMKKNNAINNGKKLGQTDGNYMKVAEDILYGEFAASLEIPKEEVISYIENRIKEIKKN